MKKLLNRRSFLAAMGLAAGSLYLPSLRRPARAEVGGPPCRMIIFFTQHGTWYPNWNMRWPGEGEDATWVHDLSGAALAEFSPALAPLHAFRDKMTVVDGLALVSGDADPAAVLRHEIAQMQALTGAMVEIVAGLPLASAASLDQIVADAIADPTRFRSLELGIGHPPPSINARGHLQMLPFEARPPVVWDRLFGLVNGGSLGSDVLKEQSSVLDRVRAQHDALAGRLSGEDRAKLEIHRDLVRELEQRVNGLLQVSCEPSPMPMSYGEYAQDFTTFVGMLTAAFSCDLVRVATLHAGDIPGEILGYEDIHDAHAHQVFNNDLSKQVMTEYSAYHAQQFAELLTALDAIPEGGGTMLDNTLCVWLSELGDGAHGFTDWPVVIAGGGGFSGIQTGRYIHYPKDVPFEGWTWSGVKKPSVGRPHQKLLTSLARAMGVTGPDGDQISAMPVTELTGINGAKIDCTGVLGELFS